MSFELGDVIDAWSEELGIHDRVSLVDMLVEPSEAADVVRVMIEALGGDAATSYARAMAEAQRARVARERAAALDVAREEGRASAMVARALGIARIAATSTHGLAECVCL